MTIPWRPEELRLIGQADEVHIATTRGDGTFGPAVPVWVVRVRDQLYVRTWYRRDTGWFGRAMRSHRARIARPTGPFDVVLQDVADDHSVTTDVSTAYRAKYARYGAATVDAMVTTAAAATTLRLTRAV
ncbi:hypothetical protein SAMN04515671_1786 [Nakamurella panacisegetis]|uniref:DUF2255 family protein n=1 Tax=Nakamurella panacisegetis TaxID=1090615 RepID=A0A1H0LT42_9ACTN|nr:DUF2255 family protein [Nakamurella panacisegetis]SDO71156.1 hypothetical protein SAMN04515671_1786 [Nakamurella panacisegetis]